jgi:hypothetical protein
MPCVKTEKGYFGGKEFTMRVNVAGDGVFRINLPKWAHGALGVEKIEKDTLDAAIKEFKKQREKYLGMLSSQKKVIRYMFKIQDKTARYGGGKGERDQLQFGVGKGIQFGIANLFETTHYSADGKVLRKEYDHHSSRDIDAEKIEQPYPEGYNYSQFGAMASARSHECNVVEWTQEREDWFMALCMCLDGLIGKLKSLDENQDLLLEAVKSQLLIGGPSAK